MPVLARNAFLDLSKMLKRPKEVAFEIPQPPAPFPPSQRSGAFIGPSGVGKTTTAISMLMGPYKHCYSRVYVFSPSCAPGIDPAWDAWRKHVKVHMRVPDDEQTMWDTWEPETLERLIERHKKVNAHLKHKNTKRDMLFWFWLTILLMLVKRLCIVQQTY